MGLMEVYRKLQLQEYCMKPVYKAACIGGPKYEISILSGEEINRAYTFITVMSYEGKVLGSLVNPRTKPGLWEGNRIYQHIYVGVGNLL